MGSRGAAPSFLAFALDGSSELQAPSASPPGKEPVVSIGEEDEWAPEPVCSLCVEKESCPGREIEPQPSSPQPAAMPTELTRLPYIKEQQYH
jgi:hypothetical protein